MRVVKIVLAALAGGLLQQAPAAAETCPVRRIVFSEATDFLGDGLERREATTVVVANGRIESISPGPWEGEPSACVTVVDARGRFLVPGLWDLHLHLSKGGSSYLPHLPRLGITGVRDMGSSLDEVNEIRRRADRGLQPLPHISSPGAMFEREETLAALADDRTLEPWRLTRQAAAGDTELLNRLSELRSAGANFVKIRSAASADEFRRIARAARAVNLGVAAHPPPGLRPSELEGLGIVSIEHASYPYPLVGGEDDPAAIAATFRRLGITIVPTLSAWRSQIANLDALRERASAALSDSALSLLIPPRLAVEWSFDLGRRRQRPDEAQAAWTRFYDQLVADLRALYRNGARLAAGSDVGVETIVPGLDLLREICLLETEIGMAPSDVLRANTIRAAELAGFGALTGSIAVGKSADLILLDSDPSASLTRALASLRMTVLRGEPIANPDRAVLDRVACEPIAQ